MTFDSRHHPPGAAAGEFIRQSKPETAESDFYGGGMLRATRRGIHFVAVPTEEIVRALPVVAVALTLRTPQATARLRRDYEAMLAKSGLRRFLQRQFRKTVEQTCDWLQQGQRHHRPPPSAQAVETAFMAYDLHHRIPLALGGTNAYENLVFIPRPVHQRIHDIIRLATPQLQLGVTETVGIPYPSGIIPLGSAHRVALRQAQPA